MYLSKTSLRTVSAIVAALSSVLASSQSFDALTFRAVESSPAVLASRSRLDAAQSWQRSASSPFNPQLELSPGVGYTNGNLALSQRFDLSGQRAATARAASAEALAALAEVQAARNDAAHAFRSDFALWLAAREKADAASLGESQADATLRAVTRRVEVGEAPAVHATQAEIELQRARHAAVLARAQLDAALAALTAWLGSRSPSDWEAVGWTLAVPDGDPVALALSSRPEVTMAEAGVKAAEARQAVTQRASRPDLVAGLAADTWSLDRRPFQRDNVGFQVMLSLPLLDLGRQRFAERAADAERAASEAKLAAVTRQAALEAAVASAELRAAQAVARSYATEVRPKAEQTLAAIQAGFESGLTTFLEVLEAQRTLTAVRLEEVEAVLSARLAQSALVRAMGLSGTEGVDK
jgi:outer membrane protein, heavy metal efflux system